MNASMLGTRGLRRLPVRIHLLALLAAALIPVWVFAAYLLAQYAFDARSRFESDAVQVARQVSLVVENQLSRMQATIEGLSKSSSLQRGDIGAFHVEASRLVEGTGQTIVLRHRDDRHVFSTGVSFGSALPPATSFTPAELARLDTGLATVSEVYPSAIWKQHRFAVAVPVTGPGEEDWVLAITAPTSSIRDIMMPVFSPGWVVAVGDRDGTYVARSQRHEEVTGQPGLPEYVEKIVGRSGTFVAPNFQNTTLIAGYYRSPVSEWFYTANIPLSVAQAPLWRSVMAIGLIGVAAMVLSTFLAYRVGLAFAGAAAGLADRAEALGNRTPVLPLQTSVREFSVIADALGRAETALNEGESEMQAVLETVPAAVWFTYDPDARLVIRNRFAAELMGMPLENRKSFGVPDAVIDTVAVKDGVTVGREDRPLSRAMRGEETVGEESTYYLPSGGQRTLLTSARPIRSKANDIVGAVQISLDISERKRGEEQRKLLAKELNHRVKNTLAVVQAIVSQTLRNTEDIETAKSALTSRLISLSKAHDVLTQENWSGANLRDVMTGTIAPQAELERFAILGEDVRVSPSLALSLSLGIHELTTNAIKYGALSTGEGSVSLSWTVHEAEGKRKVRIQWRESGGPIVEAPERRGFGTRMIERVLDAESTGEVIFRFDPQGVICIFEAAVEPDV